MLYREIDGIYFAGYQRKEQLDDIGPRPRFEKDPDYEATTDAIIEDFLDTLAKTRKVDRKAGQLP